MTIDILALMERDAERRRLVRRYEILRFEKNPLVPCMGVVAQLDAPIGDVIPVLFIMNLGRASYLPDKGILSIRRDGRLVVFYPDGRVALNRAWTEKAARRALDEVLDMVNDAYRELLREGPPSEEELARAMELTWRDILVLLPGANCGKCGRQTCQSLAIDVLRGEARLSDCPLLMGDARRLEEARKVLGRRIARALGL